MPIEWMHWLWWCWYCVGDLSRGDKITSLNGNYFIWELNLIIISFMRSFFLIWQHKMMNKIVQWQSTHTQYIPTFDYSHCAILKWLSIMEWHQSILYSRKYSTLSFDVCTGECGRAEKGWNKCTHSYVCIQLRTWQQKQNNPLQHTIQFGTHRSKCATI